MNNQPSNDEAFEPLFRALAKMDLTEEERVETISNYMFMFEDNGRFAYKHYFTRQYVYIDQSGTMDGGILNTGRFEH